MTPYQRHMAVTKFQSNIYSKETMEERRKMEQLMQKYIRSKKYSSKMRKKYGDDYVQPQCLNLELCYEEQMAERETKYGLKARQKVDDVVINNQYQDNLVKMVTKHYKKT